MVKRLIIDLINVLEDNVSAVARALIEIAASIVNAWEGSVDAEARFTLALLELEIATRNLHTIPRQLMRRFLLSTFTTPPAALKSKVVPALEAYKISVSVLRSALSDASSFFGVGARITRWSDRLGSWKTFRERIQKGIEQRNLSRLERLIFKIGTMTLGRFVRLIWAVLDTFVQFMAGWFGLLVAIMMISDLEEAVLAATLSQANKRRQSSLRVYRRIRPLKRAGLPKIVQRQ